MNDVPQYDLWAAPVGAPPSELHPSRLEGWAFVGKVIGLYLVEADPPKGDTGPERR